MNCYISSYKSLQYLRSYILWDFGIFPACFASHKPPSTFVYSGGRSNKTFKPKKNIPEGTHQYDLMKHAAVTLGSGNLRQAVMLPEGEDLNEWVAVNSKYSFLSGGRQCGDILLTNFWYHKAGYLLGVDRVNILFAIKQAIFVGAPTLV